VLTAINFVYIWHEPDRMGIEARLKRDGRRLYIPVNEIFETSLAVPCLALPFYYRDF
jgi:hypothetical protein